MRFTKPALARLELPTGKSEAIVFDDDLPGFGLRLRAGGKKTWIAQYRLGQKQRRVSLGSTATLDLDAARAEARKILAKVTLGSDAAAEKSQARARAAMTLGAAIKPYLAYKQARMRVGSYDAIERHLLERWKPLREMGLHDIDRARVAARLAELAAGYGPVAADRARASLSAFFVWAMKEGLVGANPVVATNKHAGNIARNRVLDAGEMAEIWRTCQEDDHGRIVRLLLLTGARREEVGGMTWDELGDLDKAVWTLPPERTKNGRPHAIPLSAPALAILRAVPRIEDRTHLFGRGAKGGFAGWSQCKARLDRRIIEGRQKAAKEAGQDPRKVKPPAPWRLHDLRRSAATHMAELGVQPHIVEAILNHVSGSKGGIAGIYNLALYEAEKRAALVLWGAHVERLVAGGNVVALAAAKVSA